MANITGFSMAAACSMQTEARVVFRCFAKSATSSSAIKQCAFPPNAASAFLLIPANAMLVSVTISAPFFINSFRMGTAPLEKQRVSA